ncbi:hypothetical protein ACFVU3_39755 [Streptomyces sp. NPDC058052]|uniref:hypothetical protein n=1 Tax=Streptomyces sp. NPDC058052 TaxID=3346316 RepID=UPI0036EDEDFB
MIQHAEACPLYAVHWLRHAVAAAGLLIKQPAEQGADEVSAMALTDTLAYFAELPEWESVTLKDVAEHATLMSTPENRERFRSLCNCGALD